MPVTYKYNKETLFKKNDGQLRTIAVKLGIYDADITPRSLLIERLWAKKSGQYLEVRW